MKIDVPSTAFRSGALLELGRCARHDASATRSRRRRFTTEPPGVIVILAFFSFFLVLLLAALFQKDVRGQLPECDRCGALYRRRLTVMWVGILGGPAFLITAGLLGLGPVSLLGIAGLVVGVGAGVRADLARVRGTLSPDLAWVRLRGVDPVFAGGVSERVTLAPAPDPWVVPLV